MFFTLVSLIMKHMQIFRPVVVEPHDIATIASSWSGIPLGQLAEEERNLLMGLEGKLKTRIVGQEEAIYAISRAVKRSRLGLKDPNRPMGTLIFCGPSGVGKTELSKALAACYFGSVRKPYIAPLVINKHLVSIFLALTIDIYWYYNRRQP